MNDRRRVAIEIAAAVLLIAAFVVQAAGASTRMSTTSDETSHLPAGFAQWQTGRPTFNPQHPPLLKLLCALPLRFLPDVDPLLDDPAWRTDPPDEWGYGARFLATNGTARVLFAGRAPAIAIGALLGVYVALWARARFGAPGTIAALALYAFSPNFVAHAGLVTMDVPLAAFGTGALFHAWRWARSGRSAHAVGAGILLGAALATKFSAVVLAAVIAALLAVEAVRARRSPRLTARTAALAVGGAVLVVWASYGFPADPGFYLRGLLRVHADHDPEYPYYLMGRFRVGGFPHYFLVAFLVKTPLPMLVLLGAAPWLARRVPASDRLDDLWCIAPAVAVFGATSALADDLGVRYLLPMVPPLWVLVARVGPWAVRGGIGRAAAAAVLFAVLVAGAVRIHPHQLSYFNEIAGGPARGHEWLDDSNLDWGQGLIEIADWMRDHGVERVRMRYGWNGSPEAWGIRAVPLSNREWASPDPPSGWVLFSAHEAIRGRYWAHERGLPTDWIDRYPAVGRIGYHTWVFRFDGRGKGDIPLSPSIP